MSPDPKLFVMHVFRTKYLLSASDLSTRVPLSTFLFQKKRTGKGELWFRVWLLHFFVVVENKQKQIIIPVRKRKSFPFEFYLPVQKTLFFLFKTHLLLFSNQSEKNLIANT